MFAVFHYEFFGIQAAWKETKKCASSCIYSYYIAHTPNMEAPKKI